MLLCQYGQVALHCQEDNIEIRNKYDGAHHSQLVFLFYVSLDRITPGLANQKIKRLS
jgi:hypothetical protein